jgi:hypothetical protein
MDSATLSTMSVSRLRELVLTKAELLCFGIRPNNGALTLFRAQNPSGDWKTGNVGVHFSLDGLTWVLATVSHSFDRSSPYSIAEQRGAWVLLKNGSVACPVVPLAAPRWYHGRTANDAEMASVFLAEGRNFLHQTYAGCDYQARGIGCGFCATGASWRIAAPPDVGATVASAVGENPNYLVCLGGGARLPLHRNIPYFAECAREIRQRGIGAPIWVEMVPPEHKEDIQILVEAGVTSFGFNIEIWDDRLRADMCPGKGVIPKVIYFSAMAEAARLLGRNRVGSCVLVGLEPLDSTVRGVEALASAGVQPCVLPFKPWDGSRYATMRSCEPSQLMEASYAAAEAMMACGLSPQMNEGCLRCEACTIDHDLYAVALSEKEVTQ